MYDCSGYFRAPVDSDSISIDSVGVSMDDVNPMLLDDFGNPLQRPIKNQPPDDVDNTSEPLQNNEATEEKK